MTATPTAAAPATLQAKFTTLEQTLNGQLFERGKEIRTALVALIAKKHHLQVGVPGVGKTLLTNNLAQAIDFGGVSDAYFPWLMTRFTTPQEIFGPPSLKALENDVYRVNTARKLPNAKFALLDEALALDTPIPTPEGWTTMGALAVGDFVLGANGAPVSVQRITPTTMGDCYRVTFHDGTSIIADAGHNWIAKRSWQSESRVWTTQEMVDHLRTRRTKRHFRLPLPQPVKFAEADLPVDPYFLGLWLGNGNRNQPLVYIREHDADRVTGILATAGLTVEDVGSTGSSRTLRKLIVKGQGVRSALASIGVLNDKAVPPIYRRASIDQRLALVQGLMDTDGYMDPKGTCVFSNTNEDVIDGLVEILRSFGVVCTKLPAKDDRVGVNGPHRPCWKVTFWPHPDLPPFAARQVAYPQRRNARTLRISSIEPVPAVPVRCIEVDADDHLFLAGPGMTVTHNCFKANSSILNALLTIMNEGLFYNDNGAVRCDAIIFMASNELPREAELAALWDRVTIRHEVKPIQENRNFEKMLRANLARRLGHATSISPIITWAEIEQARTEAEAIAIPDIVFEQLVELRVGLRKEGIEPTERRFNDCLPLIQAQAWRAGRTAAQVLDMNVLQHVLWVDLKDQPKVQELVLNLADPLEKEASGLLETIDKLRADTDKIIQVEGVQPRRRQALEVNGKIERAVEDVETLAKKAAKQDRTLDSLGTAQRQLTGLTTLLLKECFGVDPDNL